MSIGEMYKIRGGLAGFPCKGVFKDLTRNIAP